MPAASRAFSVRHVQLSRAVLAAVAALMVTFSSDHSAPVGLAAFSGFTIATGSVLVLSAWLVYPAGRRWWVVLMGALSLAAGMAGAIPSIRGDGLYFALVIAWALCTGLVELIAGIRQRGADGARDQILIGSAGLLLGALLLLVPVGLSQPYVVEGAGRFELTGIMLGVGLFGGYAAVVAVFLGIAGFSPRPAAEADAAANAPAGDAAQKADHGGIA